jgi:hypothetical protein
MWWTKGHRTTTNQLAVEQAMQPQPVSAESLRNTLVNINSKKIYPHDSNLV